LGTLLRVPPATLKTYLVIQIRANLIGIGFADLIGSAIHFEFAVV
jgi:hypothetical protein